MQGQKAMLVLKFFFPLLFTVVFPGAFSFLWWDLGFGRAK
jgi:hypothetical protein